MELRGRGLACRAARTTAGDGFRGSEIDMCLGEASSRLPCVGDLAPRFVAWASVSSVLALFTT